MSAPARVISRAFYPDPLGRIIATADYGTNGGEEFNRPSAIPTSSLTVRVSRTEFDSAGMAFRTIDPAGRKDEKTFDDAGRLTRTVENVVAYENEDDSEDDENRRTDYEYNLDGQMTKLTARNRGVVGNGSQWVYQETQWIYGTDLETSGIARNDLLAQKIYPDSSGSSDTVRYAYNRLGELVKQTDQAGTVHEYEFDKLGRLLHDRVTDLGEDIDDNVLRISRAYNGRGQVVSVTSYDEPYDGAVVNEVRRAYNRFGQLVREWQAHGQAVDVDSTPSAAYGYEDGSANTIRPSSLSYPSGRILSYSYGEAGAMNDTLSRVEQLTDDDAQSFAAYTYLGASQVVKVDYPEPAVGLTYLKQDGDPPFGSGDPRDPGDQYAGLDRFGRIQDQRWLKQGSSSSSSSSSSTTALERVKLYYNQAENIVTRQNLVAPGGQDEVYAYDGLYQLQNFQRGTLDTDTGQLTTPADWQEDFGLDPMGNWKRYWTYVGQNPTLMQDRYHNKANEITEIDGSQGTVSHDPAGNMVQTPRPGDWTSTLDLTWDAGFAPCCRQGRARRCLGSRQWP